MAGTSDDEGGGRWRLNLHPVVLGLVVWIVLSSIATLAIWGLRSGDRSLGTRLRDHGITTLATVTGTDPADHNTVFYSYIVNGRTFQSGYFGDGPEGDASHLSVGERVHVVYDSQAPSDSCYCNVSTLAKSADWWRTAIAGLFITSVVSIAVTVGVLRRRPNDSSASRPWFPPGT